MRSFKRSLLGVLLFSYTAGARPAAALRCDRLLIKKAARSEQPRSAVPLLPRRGRRARGAERACHPLRQRRVQALAGEETRPLAAGREAERDVCTRLPHTHTRVVARLPAPAFPRHWLPHAGGLAALPRQGARYASSPACCPRFASTPYRTRGRQAALRASTRARMKSWRRVTRQTTTLSTASFTAAIGDARLRVPATGRQLRKR
jgi:hypothetical protein